MKKLILSILFILCLSFQASAFNPMIVVSGSGSGGVVCDDCSGATMFAWHMEDDDSTPDVTIGNPCGCSDGDKVGAETGTPAFSGAQKSDGELSLLINGGAEYYTFVVDADDIFNMDDFKITFDIYVTSWPTASGQHQIWAASGGTHNAQIFLDDQAIDQIGFCKNAQCVYAPTPATGEFISCVAEAKDGVEGNDMYMSCTGDEPGEEDMDHDASTSSTSMTIGDVSGGDPTGVYYLDNFKITPSTRY